MLKVPSVHELLGPNGKTVKKPEPISIKAERKPHQASPSDR